MADKTPRKASDQELAAPGPDRIRNVALVGPTQSGKTALVEALARVTLGQDRSVSLSVAPVVHVHRLQPGVGRIRRLRG